MEKENQDLRDTESRLIKECQELGKRCDNLQGQIDRLGERNDKLIQERYQKGQESLLTEDEFDFNFQTKFERDNVPFVKNLDSERFQEPRMFTMKQIRNIIHAVSNQSQMELRIQNNEDKHRKVVQK